LDGPHAQLRLRGIRVVPLRRRPIELGSLDAEFRTNAVRGVARLHGRYLFAQVDDGAPGGAAYTAAGGGLHGGRREAAVSLRRSAPDPDRNLVRLYADSRPRGAWRGRHPRLRLLLRHPGL